MNGAKRHAAHLVGTGILPLPWFLVWTTVGGLVAPGYSPVAQHASELGLLGGWPAAFLDVAAFGCGSAFALFGAGLWTLSGRRFAAGACAWIVFGMAMLSNGIWRMGSPWHGLFAIGIVNIVAPALSAVDDERLAFDPVIRVATIVATGTSLIYLWLNLTGNDPNAWRGLTQRVFSSLNSAWPMIVALRFGRITSRER